MSNIVQKQEAALSTELTDWGKPEFIGAQDVIIPKILPMQGLSQKVTDGEASFGEFRDSLSNNLIGSMAKPFDVIPFHVQKVWDINEMQADGKFKWKKTIPLVENPIDPNYNDNLSWEGEENGTKVKRIRRMNFYVMLPSEVEAGTAMPYIISFKSTSFKEGKKLFTQMFIRNLRANLPPPAYVFTITGVKQKNDAGTYMVPTVSLGRRSTNEEMAECLSWFKLIKQGSVKIDESDVQTTHDESAVADENVEF